MSELDFRELFTDNRDVVFAFHGYPGCDPPVGARSASGRPCTSWWIAPGKPWKAKTTSTGR